MNPVEADQSASTHPQTEIIEPKLDNDSVRLNPEAPNPSRFQLVLAVIIRRMSLKNVSQGLLLVLLLALIVYFSADFFDNPVLRAKRLFKLSGSSSIELAGMDETSFRAYYFYLEMVKQSRQNAKKKVSYEQGSKKYKQISFWELYSLFKVVKAIQNAKNYSNQGNKPDEQIKQQIVYDNLDELKKPYNYSSFFNPAANQYSCGSCYSFPITATIEYLYKVKLNKTIKLAEQQLIDCTDEKVDGCQRGNITKGFMYARDVGLVESEYYPYRSKGGNSFPCRKTDVVENKTIIRYPISGFRVLPEGDCMAIQNQLAKGNVVASMINAEQLSGYEKGTFRDCRKDGFNHAITIVGQTANQQWIVRNSWGTSFGDNGYFLMGKGNTCGVCTHMIVPELNVDAKGNVIPLKND